MAPDHELPVRKAHGKAAVAAPAGLEEHDRATLGHELGDGLERRRCGDDTGHHALFLGA